MQLKAACLAAIVAASSVSATPIENGLTQKHVVVQHNSKICISKHQVDACVNNTRATSFRKINMPVVCREQFDDQYIVRAQQGEKIDEIYQATATDFVQRQVPRSCVDEQEEGSEQQQQQSTRAGARRSQWQPIRGAHANKHMINEDENSESEQYLKLKLARFNQNQIPQFKQQFEQYKQQKSTVEGEKNEWESEQTNVSEQIRSTWSQLSLHRMMKMSEKEHQKINQQLRLMLAQKPEVAGWLFQYETELPMIFTKLAQTLREFMLQPYWTEENEQVSQVLSHQYNTAANRIWTYIVKQLLVEREQQQTKSEQTTVPELEEIVKRVWEEAKEELHQTTEVETTERNYNKFLSQLKEQKPEQYKSMFKIFTQFNLNQEESHKIAKYLLQLIIASFQVSNPEHSAEFTSQEEQHHQLPIWNSEELQTAEQNLREAVQKDWSQFQRHFQSKHQNQQNKQNSEEQDQEYENSEDAEQQWTDKQESQQQGALRGVFGKLKVAFKRFEQTIRGQRVNNDYNN